MFGFKIFYFIDLDAIYSTVKVSLPEFVLRAIYDAFGDIDDSCNFLTFYLTSANLNQLIRKLKKASPKEKLELIEKLKNASYEEKVQFVMEILENGSKRQRGSLRKMIKLLKNIGSLIKDSPLDNSALHNGEFHKGGSINYEDWRGGGGSPNAYATTQAYVVNLPTEGEGGSKIGKILPT